MIGTEKSANLLGLVFLAKQRVDEVSSSINQYLSGYEPLTLIIGTVFAAIAFKIANSILAGVYSYMRDFRKNIVVTLFNAAIRCPLVKKHLN